MELNHRFLFVGQESLPLDHGTVDSLGIAPRSQACGACVFLLDDEPIERKLDHGCAAVPDSNHKWLSRPTVFKTVTGTDRRLVAAG
jgi:hypothetical protein